ncbi:MAG: response regulator [Candidatus Acidiferrales bacterium]
MRILVVDDQELIRRGIRSVLAVEPTFKVCGEAIDGLDAVEKATALRPDVVVMDISMPRMNGLEAIRQIKRVVPEAEIVVISQHVAPELVRQAVSAGARAYLDKFTISTDLRAAIEKIAGHETYVPPSASDGNNQNLDRQEILKQKAGVSPAERGSAPIGFAVNSRDDSEPREAQETLRKEVTAWNILQDELAKQARLLDFSFNAVIVLGEKGRITYWNKGAEELYGWTREEALGRIVHTLLQTKFAEPLDSITSRLRREDRWQGELVHKRKDGERITVLSRWALTRDAESNSESIMEVNIDITQTKEAERKLQTLVQTLETRISDRTQELENVTHELRELSGKLLHAQDEERRRIARELHDGVGQLLAAMNMNFSTLADERTKLSVYAQQSLDENAILVEQASQELRTMSHLLHPPLLDEVGLESAVRWYVEGFAERSRITVQTELDSGFSKRLPRELALSLFRIVQETLTNVHRHSGSLTALVRIARSAGEITLEVSDQGRGIPGDLQSRISSGESSGVGLRGVRERIRQFGGRFNISSDQKGTTVTAVLPVPDSANRREGDLCADELESAHTNGEKSNGKAATILCIDDEVAGLLPRKLLLESAGHRVIQARSGEEGIKLFRTEKVSAVILDYWMSGMKGTVVASKLKRINPSVPIIVLSGVADLPGEAAGVVDQWIMKGSTRSEELLNFVSALLDRRPLND